MTSSRDITRRTLVKGLATSTLIAMNPQFSSIVTSGSGRTSADVDYIVKGEAQTREFTVQRDDMLVS